MAYLIITSVAFGAARIVTNTRKHDHITPILQTLHWLPVRQHNHFKMLLITYKSINDMAPEYLCELVSIRKSSRKLTSSSQILLQVPVLRLKSYGDCAFSVAVPTLWNKFAIFRQIRSMFSDLDQFTISLLTGIITWLYSPIAEVPRGSRQRNMAIL